MLIGVLVGMVAKAEEQPAAQTHGQATFRVYISLGQEEKLAIYQMDPRTGRLEHQATMETSGTPGALVTSPDRRLLYAAMRSTRSVTTFQVDPQTGSLSEISTAPVAENPVYLATDPPGTHLLMSSYNGHLAAAYPLDDRGAVVEKATMILETERNPHSIMVDPSGRFVFVPNTGADSILQYRYDAPSGILTANDPPKVATQQGAGPRHFYFHPTLDVVYFVNELNSTVTAYDFDTDSGTLSEKETLPTLPDDFMDTNTCADIEVTPCGRYVYASNRGHDSLAGYAVDPETGTLSALGQFPTEQTPRSFNIDPTGTFLYAAGQGNGRLASYRIDGDSGHLQPLEVYHVGNDPAWVQVVALPE